MNVTNIGLVIIVPKIRIRIESACFNLFFERNINPTVTGNIIIMKNKSNLILKENSEKSYEFNKLIDYINKIIYKNE